MKSRRVTNQPDRREFLQAAAAISFGAARMGEAASSSVRAGMPIAGERSPDEVRTVAATLE